MIILTIFVGSLLLLGIFLVPLLLINFIEWIGRQLHG